MCEDHVCPASQEGGFERSKCIVQVHGNQLLKANRAIFAPEMIENYSIFQSQVVEKAFLCLERRAKNVWRILEIILPGSVLHEVHEIAYKLKLDFSFSEAVEAEVETCLNTPLDISDCVDMREIPFVTVDGAGTRDLDQALYVASAEEQTVIVPKPGVTHVAMYAIADASYFVRPGSALFQSALERGTSMYFAGMSVPMLPHAFSRGIVSLNANVDRRALVFIMQIGEGGKCVETKLERAVIHSFAKLSNEEVDRFLNDPDHHRFANQPFATSLRRFKEVGEIRKKESASRNVVQFNRCDLHTSLNTQRTAFVLGLDERTRVDLYNEQLSLLCNMEGASILKHLVTLDPGVLAIFRSHEAPMPEAVDAVALTIRDIVEAQALGPAWHWDRQKQSLGDYLNNLPVDTDGSDRLFRIRQAIERAVLMMQRRSVFSPEAGLHSALGVNPYARFSAPMREIVGIFTHQEAVDATFNPNATSADELEKAAEIRNQVIAAANHAKDIQRELDKAIDSCAIAHAIAHDYDVPIEKRPVRRGTLLGMKSNALYVRLDNPPIELKVYLKDMQDTTGQNWSVDEKFTTVQNEDGSRRYRVGDDVNIRVHEYHEAKKKWSVLLV